jgi:hypothetical protein
LHDPFRGERAHFVLAQVQAIAQDLHGVLAEQRRRAFGDRLLAAHADGRGDLAEPEPASACGIARRMPRATTCGSANTASSSWIGPHGTPASSSATIQSCCAARGDDARDHRHRTSRLRTRSAFFANRASCAHATPATSQNFGELAVVAHGKNEMAVGAREGLVGTMFWCALPARGGGVPVTK